MNILLVEDDEVDVMSVKRALRRHKVEHMLWHARDGHEALQFMLGGMVGMPFMVLLDLHMPQMRGEDVLMAIEREPALWDVPVWVLSTSDDREEKRRMIALGARGYLVKGEVGDDAMKRMIECLQEEWEKIHGG